MSFVKMNTASGGSVTVTPINTSSNITVTLPIAGANGGSYTGSQTLTILSPGAISITFTTDFQSITLPNATTCNNAALLYNITNTSAYNGILYDAAGSVLGFIKPFADVTIGLSDNSTSAGVWLVDGVEPVGTLLESGSGFSSFSTGAQSFNLGSGYYLLYTSTTLVVFNANNNTIGSVYTPPASCDITYLDTNKFVIAYRSATNTIAALVLTISGTTITAGTAATTSNTGASTSVMVAALSTTSAVVAYRYGSSPFYAYVQIISISGTTVTFNTGVGSLGPGGASIPEAYDIKKISSTAFLLVYKDAQAGGTLYSYGCTVSGTTITAGTINSSLTSIETNGGVIISSSKEGLKAGITALGNGAFVLPLDYQQVGCITVSGTTLTVGTATANSAGTTPNAKSAEIIPITNNTFIIVYVGSSTYSGNAYATHVTNTSGATLSSGTSLSLGSTKVGVAQPFIPIIRTTPSGAYVAIFPYNDTTPGLSSGTFSIIVNKFTLSGTTLTTRTSPSSVVTLGAALTSIKGLVTTSTKNYIVCGDGVIQTDLEFTDFKVYKTKNASVIPAGSTIFGNNNVYWCTGVNNGLSLVGASK